MNTTTLSMQDDTTPAPAAHRAAGSGAGGTTAVGSGPRPAVGPADRRAGARWGRLSLILGLVAMLGGVLVAALIGVTIAPEQAAAGRYLSDAPQSYQWLVILGLGSFALWSLAALAALVTGIVALVRTERPVRPLVGLLSGLFAPALWFAAFAVPALVMASVVG